MRTVEEFNGKYTGQPAVIIASGPSLYLQDLSLLSGLVCIVVNSGYIAMPDADFFISDDWSIFNWRSLTKCLIESRTTVLLYEDKLKHAADMFDSRAVLYKHRCGYNVTDDYSHTDYSRHILQCRTSVGSAVHVCHIMGCSPILLLGVDCRYLNGNRYFWQFDRKKYKMPIGKGAEKKFIRMNAEIETDTDLMEIAEYWRTLGKEFAHKCTIFNGSPISEVDVFEKISIVDFCEKYKNAR